MGIYEENTIITVIQTVRVGDRVWYDNDGDGLQDDPADEPGVQGVTVTLFDGNGDPVTDMAGNPVGPEVTDGNGNYLFEDLPPGDYYVVFDLATLPTGYDVTGRNATNDQQPAASDQADSDGHPTTGRTPTTDELAGGEEDLTLDLGIVAPVSVGDRVWVDENSDGIQGVPADEPGVEGVTVMLFKADGTPVTDMNGNPVGPEVTDSDGNYLFENLPPGDYYVQFDLGTLPDGYGVTRQDSGSDDAKDSDADPTTGQTDDTGFLVSNSHDPSLDMGIVSLGEVTVGDRVWYDTDRNGIQDAGEDGVESVVAMLFNADGTAVMDMDGNPVGPQITDSNGNYLFENLPPGDYFVRFDLSTLPADYIVTSQDATNDQQPTTSDQLDSDTDPDTGKTADTGFLPAGSEDLTLDMGIVQVEPVRVGNRVWYDNDSDGLQDDPVDEPGVAGVTVTLVDGNGDPVTDIDGNAVGPVVTDDNGNYLFENLPPGEYAVQFDLNTLPASYGVTKPNVTSPQPSAPSDQLDSDANPSTGSTGSVTIPSGENLTLDMGIVSLDGVRVGDRVWLDENRDGLQDPGEPGLSGVGVMLYDVLGSDPVATTVTDGDGNYLFDGLVPGDYYVVFDLATLPDYHVVTEQNAGADDGVDSDVDPENGRSNTTGVLFGGEEDLTLDMGVYPLGNVTVGDLVWYDDDQDGIQGSGETGVENVTVRLYDVATDDLLATTMTDALGNYLFDDLPPGDYYVVFDLNTLPVGYVPTMPNATNDQQPAASDQSDSDADPATGETMPTDVLFDGEADLTLDMGIYQLPGVEVGNRVWFDDNGNGVQETGEAGVPGVTAQLFNAMTGEPILDEQGEPWVDVTDSTGAYLFENLPPGQYYVVFDLETLPEDHTVSAQTLSPGGSVADPATGQTMPTDVLINGQKDHTLDMGIWKPVEVGDKVWFDDDGDGVQDNDEAGVAGVTVTLYNNSTNAPVLDERGNPLTAVTDEAGNYLFSDLPPGDYYSVFDLNTLPDGYIVTVQEVGSQTQLDSDGDPSTGQTGPTGFIPSGGQDLTLDMGIVRPVEVGNRVWLDDDANGVQDEGEAGVPGIGVTLYDGATGEPVTDDAGNPLTDVTDDDGHYGFSNLPPGDYYVVFDLEDLPADHLVTRPNTTSDQVDSDVNPGTGESSSTGFLTDGASDQSLDMGIYSVVDVTEEEIVETPIRVGGTLWVDENSNGQVDETEQVLAGITVALYSVTDPETSVATQVTDEDGYYLFENVPEGEYFTAIVPETLPEDAVLLKTTSDDADTLRTTTGPLEDDDQSVLLDLPVMFPGSLSGQVWLDPNGDGMSTEEDASGLADIPVLIYNEQGELVAETVTDDTGHYIFPDLLPGLYQVAYGTPDGYGVSPFESDDNLRTHPDSEANTALTEMIMIGAGDHLEQQNVGLYPGASIGNLIWEDLDGDGIQDEGESGLPQVVLQLFNDADELVSETTTDENGNYLFNQLIPGDYYMIISQPEERVPGLQNELSLDTESDQESVRTPIITLEPGESDTEIDLNFVQPSAIGNLVWLDTNQNGLYDATEVGISSVTVWLYDSDGNLVDETQTDAEGHFEFMVPAGEYQIEFAVPAGMEFTVRDNGDESLDSDADPESGRTEITVLMPGETDHSFYAGLIVSPTAIHLMSLVAKDSMNGVVIEWSTGAEFATFGFEVYRSRDGSFENAILVTDGMVLARGGDTLYTFVDSTAHPEQIYSYWLVEVQNDGQIYRYGPSQVITSQPQFVMFLPIIQR